MPNTYKIVGNILTIKNCFMNKTKKVIMVASMLLITAGVFAGKKRFSNDLYVSSDAINFTLILTGGTFQDLQTTANGNQVTITGATSTPVYKLYYGASAADKVYSSASTGF